MFIDRENLLTAFGSIPGVVEAYFRNIPEGVLDRKRNEASWSIREHLYHIANVQEMLYSRINKIKDEEKPVIMPYFPDGESDGGPLYGSVDQAISHFKAMREKQISLINQLTESDFEKEAKHGEYTRYNIPVIINHMIFHEYWHMYRIEEIWLTRDEYFE